MNVPTDAEIDLLLSAINAHASKTSPYHGLDLWPVEKREPLRQLVRGWLATNSAEATQA